MQLQDHIRLLRDLFSLVMKTNKYGDHAAFLGSLFHCLIVLEVFPSHYIKSEMLLFQFMAVSCFHHALLWRACLCVVEKVFWRNALKSCFWSLVFSRFDKPGSFSFSSQGKCSSSEHLSLASAELTPVYWSLALVGPKVSHYLQLLVYRNNFVLFFQHFCGTEML